MAEDHTTRAGTGSTSKPSVRLTCELCRQRKVKCDKLNPCTNCQRLGATCVPVERARLPRGRSKRAANEPPGDESVLRDRVSRLEDLVRHMTEGDGRSTEAQRPSPSKEAKNVDSRDPDSSRTSSYWRDASKRAPDTDVHASSTGYMRLLSMPSRPSTALSPPVYQTGTLETIECEKELCRLFLEKVDPYFKILHKPSLSMFLLAGKPYLDYEPGHPAPTALAYAVYHAAACSLRGVECSRIFKTHKSGLVDFYRQKAESALARADFIISNDLTVLQAYVLFLLASRTQDQSRRVWTMLSMALRIGQALYLHRPEPPFPVRPFEREMRRRLWAGIGFLDVEASLDRASEPMMQSSWLTSHSPLNINDSEISFDMESAPVQGSTGFTDMTFTMIVLKAQCVSRLLTFSNFMENTANSILERQHLVIGFQQTASQLLQHAQPDRIPFHWFTRAVAECTNSSMQLITLRPLQRIPGFVPPPVRGDRLLQIAVDVLLKSDSLRNDPRADPWQWVEYAFVPWHPLAVALAELCECDDLALMEKFWAPVQKAYESLGGLVADSRKGAFWKPLEKMMNQAEAKRETLLAKTAMGGYADMGFGATSSSQVPACPQSDVRTSLAPAPPLGQNSSVYVPPVSDAAISEADVFGAWPCVWDAVDFGNAGIENEMSWLNYENFIGGLSENIDYSLLFRG
ncbi:fungal-specific transcription factor domain-containing protein [Aspergillus ambiguus]|uniref:Zn(II)2Cys6 transcription factor n=1 Tax=Aspergillus ambiguus TaxID=176160 RepID=UPI003CCDAEDF